MRITDIQATVVAVPFRHEERWAFGVRRGMVSVLLEVHTDEGIVGIGEAPAYPTADIVLAVVGSLRSLVVGEDPVRIERIVKRIEAIGTWHHVRGSSPAIGGVEMACWDIVGKVAGLPVCDLLGGRVRDEVEYFRYLGRGPADAVAEEARAAVARGFGTLYLKVGWGDPADDVALIAAVREAIGPGAGIRVDANESWSSGTAIRVLRELEPYGLESAEQPISGRNLSEMAYVRGRIGMPLLANEATWSRHDVLQTVAANAADMISVDNLMDGGLLNMKRAAGIAEAAGIGVLKHSLGELGVATCAAAHVIASTPNFLYANQGYQALLADDVLVGGGIAAAEGSTLTVPDAPGIGVELDRDKVATYAEQYRTHGHEMAFTAPSEATATPTIPRR